MSMNKIQNNLILELHVPDFTLVKDFYCLFGFMELSHDPVSDGQLGYMVLKREDNNGGTLLNFYGGREDVSGHEYFKDMPKGTPRGYEVEVTITVSDIDVLWSSIKDRIRLDQIAQPLTRKRWGQKDFRVIDPFGFYVRFTEIVDWGQ